jgi:ribose 5-phosphate isomerase B
MRVALGSDEMTPTVAAIDAWLRAAGHDVARLGAAHPTVTDGAPGTAWPDVGRAVGEAVAAGAVDVGVVCCWTGTGVSIAANKVPGVRAALCTDATTVQGARRWNDANVLAVGLRLTTPAVAAEMLDAFFSTAVDASEVTTIAGVERDGSR